MSDAPIQQIRLSPQQRRLWLLMGNQTGNQPAFAAQAAVLVEGNLDAGALGQAVQRVVDSHEILRTAFRRKPGIKVPTQTVLPRGAAGWREIEAPVDLGRDALRRWLASERERPFDLEAGAPLDLALARLDEGRHLLLLRLPALSADARTLGNLLDAIARSLGGQSGEAEEEPLQYADVSEWLNELLAEEQGEGKAFWARQEVPGKEAAAADERFAPASVPVDLPSQCELGEVAEGLGVPLSTLLLGLWLLLLERLEGRSDPVTGAMFDGRKLDDLQPALGLFARCLPLRVPSSPGWSLRDLLAEVRRAEEQAREWEESAAWEPEQASFPAVFERIEIPAETRAAGLSFRPVAIEACSEPFRLKLSAVSRGGELDAELWYDPAGHARREVLVWASRFAALAREALAAPASLLDGFTALGEAERHQMLVELNDTAAGFAAGATLHEIFESQAARTPDAPAVVCEGRSLSFAELDEAAGRLAQYLRGLGVRPESRVAIFLDRSPELIVALLGVLKAGGAYVPLDPAFPPERLRGMLEDAGAEVVVTRERMSRDLPPLPARLVRLDAEAAEIARCPAQRLSPAAVSGNLVYVLFTSGSTGRPKGVAIQHGSLVNYVRGVVGRLGLPPGSAFAMVSTFAADLGNTALFPALCTGGCLHLIPQERASDPVALAESFRNHPVDCLKIVPSHLEALLAAGDGADVLPRRRLVLGGEATRRELAERLRAGAAEGWLLNHYGPTEATVGSTTYVAGQSRYEGELAALPLGRPLPNQRAVVADRALRPVPLGALGELLLGGAGLARGYLDQPAATAERFLPDPWSGEPGARLYRTGDRVRLLPDGNLEFLGRIDHQVKVRGFRIELGEIETALAQHPAVRQAVVTVREDRPGDRRLAGYVVPRDGAAVQPSELRGFLAVRLPDYMIPSALVALRVLPLTANGKVDRAALPEPERTRTEGPALAPRNEAEEILAEIWGQVLGLQQVGVLDNFFELGGDSILVIQVIARAARRGLRLTPKQFFENQTVAELAAIAGTTAGGPGGSARPRPPGPVPLTPIQAWFLEQGFPRPDHWNQSVFLRLRERLAAGPLRHAVGLLLEHHDALCLRFERTPAGWVQSYGAPGEPPLVEVDLGALPADVRTRALEAAAAEVQRGLDLARGPLLRAALFDLGRGEEGRLLLVAHHLVVDGVSWRILLEDLQNAVLPPATTSFAEWSERLAEHARSGALEEEADFWRSLAATGEPLPVDHPGGRNDVAAELSVSVELDAAETQALLQEAPAAYRTQINDLLLTALVQAFEPWTGSPRLLVDLEGHGREDLFPEVDLSRTVGWFTTHFPVLLDLGDAWEPGDAIRAVKEQLRRIPRHGIGHGLLLYLASASDLRGACPPEVSFNYLGQLDQALAEGSPFAPAAESSGPAKDARAARRCPIEVVGGVLAGRLQMSWRYSEELHERATIERLARSWIDALRALVEHCRSSEAGGFTPSDFPLAGLDQSQLERIAGRVGQARPKS